ncbi:unnamed protein product [Phaeothamnion confervicola]
MDFKLTPEQEAFRTEVRAFIRKRLPEDIRQRLAMGHPARKEDVVRFQRILNERGWAAPHWPKQYGGADLGQAERLILQEEIQRAPAPMPSIFNVVMLGPLLLRFGTQQQRDHFLPKLASGELWFCQGFSEPGSGSDLASLRTSARREGNEYIVNGQKIWTSSAHQADWVFCLVRTEQAARKQDGITFLLMDMRSPGITVRPIVSIDNAHHLNEVFFDNVRAPVENLVGEEGRGWDCAKFLLGNERTGIANVAYCRERLDFVRALTRQLTQGGRPLAEDAVLQAELAALDAEVRALEVTNWRMLLAPGTALAGPSFASVLKLKGTEIQQDLVALIARMGGPTALERRPTEGEGSEHWAAPGAPRYFQSRAASIYGGSSEIQKDILAKAALG